MNNHSPLLVTGATGGIGSAIATNLAKNGHSLILAVRNTNKANELARTLINQYDVSIKTLALDYEDAASVAALSQSVLDISGLVLCPPRISPTFDPLPEEEVWQEVFTKVFIQPLMLVKAMLSALKVNAGGSLVVLSGISSKQALSHYAINNAIRSAWLAQAKSLSLAFGPELKVNTVSLGGVMTPNYTEKLKQKAESLAISMDELMVKEVDNVPLKRYAEPEDVAEAVRCLLGPLARHMTGQNIVLDGGFIKSY